MPRVLPEEYTAHAVRRANRLDRIFRRAHYRARWWFPLFVLLIGLSGCWSLLKADQFVAEALIWPTKGAQFVEVGPLPDDPAETGGRLMIVIGGVNRKSGTGAAAALMPSLSVGHTRVVSLVYGSGINEKDIQDKFDTLLDQYQPREVSFFGSSMGGDVALTLAGHLQQRRTDYRGSLLAELPATGDRDPGAAASRPGLPAQDASGQAPVTQRDRTPGGQVGAVRGLLITPDSVASARLGTVGVTALTSPQLSVASPAAGVDAHSALGGGAAAPSDPSAVGVDPAAAVPPLRPPPVPPRLGTVFLDCSPLAVDDVRDVSRTQADALTAVTEALHTDGGVAVRLTAEVLTQQGQWSTGRFPFLRVRPDELLYKIRQVWHEKIDAPGVSTQLIKDQYGVIRRVDIDDVAEELGPGARIVYFRPVDPDDDHTVRVDRVESALSTLAADHGLVVRIVAIPGGQHASAESDSDLYRHAIDRITGSGP